ncbi:MAG: SDR family oxidoreductase [Gemmatimonadota bacterium]|nr:SDR family oxidoreductase [Gemmatimonadota bacterium]MDH3366778.1 SDR family oxidoreductase [Gemmatimonadota bacterium]MDH3479378.1 SDR family oxidoreductase [Gemmatimonadota bacterium]MDH3569067.1 SDR family oxidoreductase [Gemmatimonadota bacterium]MDH5548890.1 SDR family oxidoreductase [Gemmatimonadota bacterium]
MDLNLDSRVALVCGSSSGLGLAIARALSREGCAVAMNGRDQARLDRAVASVAQDAARPVQGFQADVSDPAQVSDVVSAVIASLGPIDILLCNAGGPPATAFAAAPPASWQAALDLNLLSTVNLCRAVVPGMRERGWGRVICLTSVAAKQPLGDLILSTTARAGVLGFAKALADEVAADGVTVNTICPGYMRTERSEELFRRRAGTQRRTVEQITSDLVANIPMRRLGEPAELGATVAFLASEAAGYITGVALAVDGGFVRSIV